MRDSLLNLPVSDLDLAVACPVEELLEKLEQSKLRVIPTGLKHGTITVLLPNRHLEITNLRSDVETYGRHAKVEYIDSWEEDAKRRDFTINAIYLNPDGTIFDPLNGRSDLQVNQVRFIGDPELRIKEDYLRILRYFRFSSRFATQFDDLGLQACTKLRHGLQPLAGERKRDELAKILTSPKMGTTLQLMADCQILKLLLPQPLAIQAAVAVSKLTNSEANDWLVLLAALGKRNLAWLKKAAKILVLSKHQLGHVSAMTNQLPQPLTEASAKQFIYRYGLSSFLNCLTLELNQTKAWQKLHNWEIPQLPINGYDILKLMTDEQLAKDKRTIGSVLTGVEEFWLEQNFSASRDQCLELAERLISAQSQ